MVAYRFYYADEKGNIHFVGTIAERRRHPGRITHQSILKRWRKIAGHIPMQEGHRIHFEQVEL